MKEQRKEITSARLENFRARLAMIEKSKKYLEKELPRLRDRESDLRKKISKERKAIYLVNRAKRLR